MMMPRSRGVVVLQIPSPSKLDSVVSGQEVVTSSLLFPCPPVRTRRRRAEISSVVEKFVKPRSPLWLRSSSLFRFRRDWVEAGILSSFVVVEQDEDEINERFDLALFLQKQTSSTRGKRRARKFRPPDPPGSTLSTERSLSLLRKKLNIPDEIELVVPKPNERAEDPPEGDRPNTEGSEQLEDSLGLAQSSRVQREEGLLIATCRKSESFPWGFFGLEFSLFGLFRRHSVLDGASTNFQKFSAQDYGERQASDADYCDHFCGADCCTYSGRAHHCTASARPTTAPGFARPTTAPSPKKPTTALASAKPTTAPTLAKSTTVPPSEPRDTSSAKKTTTNAKGSRLPSATRTKIVPALPALSAPLPFDYDAKKAEKIRVTRAMTFLALVNKVGHELEAEVENLKRKLEDETHRTENPRTAVEAEARKSSKALLTEAERSAMALAAAEEREQCSAAILAKRDGELATVVERLWKADVHIQSLERKFTRARDKFYVLRGDPRGNMPPKLEDELSFLTADVAEHAGDEELFERLMKSFHGLLHVLDPQLLGGTGPCKAAIVDVDGKFSLIGGVGAEVTKSRIGDVAKGARTIEAPIEMRTDEDSVGPRIDAFTEDSRLDDVFGETEAEGVPVA
ncbi:hypothetical protein AALP_AAs62920U000700 [Arabis alpina]|uniref:Uncharacterized protein n=1 Tax=Arabis alpina TaxID=50452 RepID=A0A087FYM9_ARAAL|nr:hypothetical protein AALP_AAs62920U000700 [Arabis alpina]